MLAPKECSDCEGWGCKECEYFGWFLVEETDGTKYFIKKGGGPLSMGGQKLQSPWIVETLRKILKEPHDLIWASKIMDDLRKKKIDQSGVVS